MTLQPLWRCSAYPSNGGEIKFSREFKRHVLYHITGLTSSDIAYSSDE